MRRRFIYGASVVLAAVAAIHWYDVGDIAHAIEGILVLGAAIVMFYPKKQPVEASGGAVCTTR